MKPKYFLQKIDDQQITAAIAHAEEKTTGEIRVFVSHHPCPDALPVAQKHFKKLGMAKTRRRNGVLIFVAPGSQTFALIGDIAIHEKCGDGFWQALRDQMIPEFKAERYTQGIIHAINKAGEILAAHFPSGPGDDENELPNTIEKD